MYLWFFFNCEIFERFIYKFYVLWFFFGLGCSILFGFCLILTRNWLGFDSGMTRVLRTHTQTTACVFLVLFRFLFYVFVERRDPNFRVHAYRPKTNMHTPSLRTQILLYRYCFCAISWVLFVVEHVRYTQNQCVCVCLFMWVKLVFVLSSSLMCLLKNVMFVFCWIYMLFFFRILSLRYWSLWALSFIWRFYEYFTSFFEALYELFASFVRANELFSTTNTHQTPR